MASVRMSPEARRSGDSWKPVPQLGSMAVLRSSKEAQSCAETAGQNFGLRPTAGWLGAPELGQSDPFLAGEEIAEGPDCSFPTGGSWT